MWPNLFFYLKIQIGTKLKKKNCDKTQNWNCDKTQKLKLWQNSKTEILKGLKNSNYEKLDFFRFYKAQELK